MSHASLATLLKKWLANYELFTTVTRLTNNTCKHTILLYLDGSLIRDIFGKLEDTVANEEYDTVKANLSDYFTSQWV